MVPSWRRLTPGRGPSHWSHEALLHDISKPYFDPHTEVGDYVLERTLTKWLEWKTGMRVAEEPD